MTQCVALGVQLMAMILSGLELRSIVEVEDTDLGIVPTHCRNQTFLLLSQLSPPPAAHGLQRLPKLFLLAGPPHRSNAQTRFLSPRGASSDAAFQQTKLAFSESSPHRAQPQEHQRGRAPRWTCVLHSCQTFMVGKEPDT